eukprot:jgi/Mesen1/1290/ME000013S00784
MNSLTVLTVFISILCGVAFFAPEPLTSQLRGDGQSTVASLQKGPALAWLRFAHLTAFAISFGASIWATFIGGIIMFKNLPRHQFGNLQTKMFPAYFTLVITCTSICLAAFTLLHPYEGASKGEKWQLMYLGTTLICTLFNLTVMEPLTTKIMLERHKIERQEGIGQEIGSSKNKEVAKRNKDLAAMNKKFGKVHGISSLVNLASVGGLVAHMWYLACHLLL